MTRIKVTADSTCDLPPALLAQYDITLAPLTVIKNGAPYLDGVEITPEEIFSFVDHGGALCSTACVNVEDYRKLFAGFSGQYDEIIHVSIGSQFSSCFQNASIAAADFPHVHVVDSMNLSSGQGHLVLEAAQLAGQKLSAMEIRSRLNAMRSRVHCSFLLDQLEYMQKGGRCSAVTALGSKLLKIKPCIAVRDGSMGIVDKYRGKYEKCVEKYVKDLLKDQDDLRTDRVFLTHTRCSGEILEAARAVIKKYADFEQIYEADAGSTVSCHCGPNTLGVMFMTK